MKESEESRSAPGEPRGAARGMQRVFFGACVLSACLVPLLIFMCRRGSERVPPYLMVGASGLLLWTLAAACYAFRAVYRFGQGVREQLDDRTFIDDVTSVFNFRYLDQRLNEEYERTRRYGGATGVLFIDLDRFKEVNDSLGYAAGDGVLRCVAERLRAEMRSCDVLGRAGADEWIAVLPQTDRAQAEVVANRLREAVAELSVDIGQAAPVDFIRVSIGAAV